MLIRLIVIYKNCNVTVRVLNSCHVTMKPHKKFKKLLTFENGSAII